MRLCALVLVALLAVLVVYSRVFERVAFPFMVSLQTIPKVALAPILVMWLGYGILPKVMVAFLISFFPIVINSVIGMRSAEKEMIYLVQSMGAGELTTFLKIRLPKALPATSQARRNNLTRSRAAVLSVVRYCSISPFSGPSKSFSLGVSRKLDDPSNCRISIIRG